MFCSQGEGNIIPKLVWDALDFQLEEKKNQIKKRQKSKGVKTTLVLRRFRYDVSKKKWSADCGWSEGNSLFFEYILSKDKQRHGENIVVSEDFITVQFSDGICAKQDSSYPERAKDSNVVSYQYYSDQIREKLLRNGLKSPSEKYYRLLGCSNSQVKNFSFVFRREESIDGNEKFISKILPNLAELELKKGVSKRVKYTGLLFSGVKHFVNLPQGTIIQKIQSIERNNFDFTDGPGLVSMKLAKEIAKQMNISDVPSVFQIRYGGFVALNKTAESAAFVVKGIILVDPTEEERYVLSFRESMTKTPIESKSHWAKCMSNKLGIVDYSQKKIGKLNKQLVCLLSANVPHKDLLSIQSYHLENTSKCWHDPFSLGYIASMEQNTKTWDLYEKLLLQCQGNYYGHRISSEYITLAHARNRYCHEIDRIQIHLGCSRSLFGAVFPEKLDDYIKEGECLVFTDSGLLVDTVIVSRSPSYTPGDVRVLDAVDLPSQSPLRNLRNCILFSTQGSRPEADKMSGGDMDGDLYLVIWDKRLTAHAAKLRKEEPEDYSLEKPSTFTNKNSNTSPKEDWISYVSKFDNSMLGRVDRAFYATAIEKGVGSKYAKDLNKIFTSLVDKNPASLQKFERLAGSSYASNDLLESCIWEQMSQRQLEYGKSIRQGRVIPNLNDLLKFKNGMICTPGLAENIESFSEHFRSTVGKTKFSRVLAIVKQMGQQPIQSNVKSTVTDEEHSTNGSITDRANLNNKFDIFYSRWEARLLKIYMLPLSDWDKTRKNLLKRIEVERQRKHRQLDEFNQKRDDLSQKKCTNKVKIEAIENQKLELELEISEKYKHKERFLLQQIRDFHNRKMNIDVKIIAHCDEREKNIHDRRKFQEIQLKEAQDELYLLQTVWNFYKVYQRNAIQVKIDTLTEDIERDRHTISILSLQKSAIRNDEIKIIKTLGEENEISVVVSPLIQLVKERLELWQGILDCNQRIVDLHHLFESFSKWKNAAYLNDSVRKKIGHFLRKCDILEHRFDVLHITKQDLLDEIRTFEIENEKINERQEEFLTGNLRNQLQFELNKLKIQLPERQQQLNDTNKDLKQCDCDVRCLSRELSDAASALQHNKQQISRLSHLHQEVRSFLLDYDHDLKHFFTTEMVSYSSFFKLRNIIQNNENSDPFWLSILRDYFKVEEVTNPHTEEDRNRLNHFFRCTQKAHEIIDFERGRRNEKVDHTICRITMWELKLEDDLSNMTSQKKKVQSSLTKIQKKLSDVRKKINKEKRVMKQNIISTTDMSGFIDLNDSFLPQKVGLKVSLDNMNAKIRLIEEEKTSLAQRRADVTKRHADFSVLCQKFEQKAYDVRQGELVKAMPTHIFIKLKHIVNKLNGLDDLKNKFAQLESKYKCKNRDDPKILFGYNVGIEAIQSICSPKKINNLKHLIIEMKKKNSSMSLEISNLKEMRESLNNQCLKLSEEIKELKNMIDHSENDLNQMFFIERLEELETEWENTAYEDSINCGIDHVKHVMLYAKCRWKSSFEKNMDKNKLKQILLEMDEMVLRVCKIEENRVLGLLKEGQRLGRMPIYDKRAELRNDMKNSNVVIITAGTGCGKSTQLPQYIVDDFYFHTEQKENDTRHIVRVCCTQPRRLAAQSVAKRVAEEYLTSLGEMVGFRVGTRGNAIDSKRISKNTRIEFVTEGLLLHKLTKSPESISNYDCIIVDEAHERNKETDLLLAILRRFIQSTASSVPKFKLVVMSATIDPTAFSEYFQQCPAIDCPGKMHTVEDFFCPPASQETNVVDHAVSIIFNTIQETYGHEEGDVLIFLSSGLQITSCVEKINGEAHRKNLPIVAYPLYALMPEKDKEASKDPKHRLGLEAVSKKRDFKKIRKVICSTNIAETSLTIDGIRFVIEGGYAKKPTYDHTIRSKALVEREISQASAKQRRGRAGRTGPGKCFFLYSKLSFENKKSYDQPQILETPVDILILHSLHVCNKSIEHLGLMDSPSLEDIDAAKERLTDLGMIEQKPGTDTSITDDGKIAFKLISGFEPSATRMILSSMSPNLNCLHRAIKFAAIISCEEDIFFTNKDDSHDNIGSPRNHDLGDHFANLIMFEKYEERKLKVRNSNHSSLRKWCKEVGLIYDTIERIQSLVEQSYKELKKYNLIASNAVSSQESSFLNADENDRLLCALISGYFHQIADCNSMYYCRNIGFSLLEPTMLHNPRLGKESCLNTLLSNDSDSDSDEDDDSSDDDDGDTSRKDVDEYEDKTSFLKPTFNFLVYSNLLSIETNRGNLLLIRRASLINGKWITYHAPKTWIERVEFNAERPSIVKRSLNHLGINFLQAALNLYNKEKFRENRKVLLRVKWDKNKLILYGNEEDVNYVKNIIESLLKNKRDQDIATDKVIYISFPQQATFKFGPGLQINSIESKSRNVDPVSLTAKSAYQIKPSLRLQPENILDCHRYWNVKKHKQSLTIFVDSSKPSIFLKVLKKYLPSELLFISKDDTLQMIETKVLKKNLLRIEKEVNKLIEENSSAFAPEILDFSSSLSVVKCLFDNLIFPNFKHMWYEVWENLNKEWNSPFWYQFCTDTSKEKSFVNVVKYNPCKYRFEIYASEGAHRIELKVILTKKLVRMCKSEHFRKHRPIFTKYSTAVLRSVVAKQGELRIQFPWIRISLILEGNFSSNENTKCEDIDKIVIDSDFVEHIIDQEYKVTNLVIFLQSPTSLSTDKKLNVLLEILRKEFPSKSEIVLERQSDKTNNNKKQPKCCCICRRNVHHENKWKKSIERSVKERTETAGYRLKLCGCLYCRECFVNMVSSKLKAYNEIQCERCDTIILAQDCQDITLSKSNFEQKYYDDKKYSMRDKCQADWSRVIMLCFRNYCFHLAETTQRKDVLTCKNCSRVMLFDKRSSFIFCQNMKCFTLYCLSCYKTPKSTYDFVCCQDNKCKP